MRPWLPDAANSSWWTHNHLLFFPDNLHDTCFPEMEANTHAPLGLGTKLWTPWVSPQWDFTMERISRDLLQDSAKLLHVIWSPSGAEPWGAAVPPLPRLLHFPSFCSFQCLLACLWLSLRVSGCSPTRVGVFPFPRPSASSPPCALACLPGLSSGW